LVTLLTVGLIACLDRYFFSIPNPGAISSVAIVWAAYFGGTLSGLLSGTISVAYAAHYFSMFAGHCARGVPARNTFRDRGHSIT
jgi:hypothetical protein